MGTVKSKPILKTIFLSALNKQLKSIIKLKWTTSLTNFTRYLYRMTTAALGPSRLQMTIKAPSTTAPQSGSTFSLRGVLATMMTMMQASATWSRFSRKSAMKVHRTVAWPPWDTTERKLKFMAVSSVWMIKWRTLGWCPTSIAWSSRT